MKFQCECCNKVEEISDEEITKILEMHKTELAEKDKNTNALNEVAKAFLVIEEQLNSLKGNIKDLEGKIKESEKKVDEPIVINRS